MALFLSPYWTWFPSRPRRSSLFPTGTYPLIFVDKMRYTCTYLWGLVRACEGIPLFLWPLRPYSPKHYLYFEIPIFLNIAKINGLELWIFSKEYFEKSQTYAILSSWPSIVAIVWFVVAVIEIFCVPTTPYLFIEIALLSRKHSITYLKNIVNQVYSAEFFKSYLYGGNNALIYEIL